MYKKDTSSCIIQYDTYILDLIEINKYCDKNDWNKSQNENSSLQLGIFNNDNPNPTSIFNLNFITSPGHRRSEQCRPFDRSITRRRWKVGAEERKTFTVFVIKNCFVLVIQ